MTFEDWTIDAGYKHPEFGITVSKTTYLLMQAAWNAAIASSLNAVDAVVKSNIDENDVHVYIYEDLKKLLTSK